MNKDWTEAKMRTPTFSGSKIFENLTSCNDEMICPHCHIIFREDEISELEDEFGEISWKDQTKIACPACGKDFFAEAFDYRRYCCSTKENKNNANK